MISKIISGLEARQEQIELLRAWISGTQIKVLNVARSWPAKIFGSTGLPKSFYRY
jgi:hypothetical protein